MRASTQGLLRNAFDQSGHCPICAKERERRVLKKELPVRCTGSSPPHFFWRRKSSGSPHQSQYPRTQCASDWPLVALFGPVERGRECSSLRMAGRFQPRVTSTSMTYGLFQINEHCGFVTYFFPRIHISPWCGRGGAGRHVESIGNTPKSCTVASAHNHCFWFLKEDQPATARCSFVTCGEICVRFAARHFTSGAKKGLAGAVVTRRSGSQVVADM